MLSKEIVQKAVPPNLKNSITQEMVDTINTIVSDPILAETVRNNFLSYTGVLQDGKFKIEDYLHAVMYVSYKLMGSSNQEAYIKTFPERYQILVEKGTSNKDIAAYVSAYNKGKLVNLIYEQTLVPSWVLNQHIYQQAINTQYELMTDDEVSAKVRSDAADSLLNHLKKPEAVKGQISMEMRETSGINELRKALTDMAAAQRHLIENGTEVKDITGSTLIEAEARDVTDD